MSALIIVAVALGLLMAFGLGIYVGFAAYESAVTMEAEDQSGWIEPGAIFDYVAPYQGAGKEGA
jgi:hypothetical protein